MADILVTGGTGALGREVVRLLGGRQKCTSVRFVSSVMLPGHAAGCLPNPFPPKASAGLSLRAGTAGCLARPVKTGR
jgi:hypothetical protein